jgi:hypothetical protein
MGTAFWIILGDVLLFVFYLCQYRQELGLMVDGSHDEPVRRPPAPMPSPPSPPPVPPAMRGSGRQVILRP